MFHHRLYLLSTQERAELIELESKGVNIYSVSKIENSLHFLSHFSPILYSFKIEQNRLKQKAGWAKRQGMENQAIRLSNTNQA
jgi:hypothetical protein